MSTPPNVEVVVKRRFNASPARVFDAWLDPSMIGRWMFGRRLRDEDIVRIALEARVGDRFSFAVLRDGETIDHVGEYLELDRPRRLAFTWGIGEGDRSRVAVDIVPRNGGCELTLTHALHPAWTEFAQRTEGGWMTMLHALESELTPPGSPAVDDYASAIEPTTLRLERVLPGPLERVWAYLTDADKRAQWLAGGTIELRAGGRVELRFHHADLSPETAPVPERFKSFEGGVTARGRVTRVRSPTLLAITWDEESAESSEVTFELEPQGANVRLVVTHRRLVDRATRIDVASGWHTHLAILADRLRGRQPGNFWLAHAAVEAQYAKRLPQ